MFNAHGRVIEMCAHSDFESLLDVLMRMHKRQILLVGGGGEK